MIGKSLAKTRLCINHVKYTYSVIYVIFFNVTVFWYALMVKPIKALRDLACHRHASE